MAKKRMFSLQIIDTDAFLDMSVSAQALYFHLSMRADDDGFVDNPKRIMRMIGSQDDDLKILLTKRFILGFKSGIVVIKHWRMQNLIRKDRYIETPYTEEKKSLKIKENGAYTENVIPNGNQVHTTGCHRLDKVSIDKNISKDINKFGNKNINHIIEYFKKQLNAPLDGTQKENRKYANLLINKLKKNYPDYDPLEQIEFLINIGLKDNFHSKNLTNLKYLYYNMQKIIRTIKNNKNTITSVG